MQFAAKTTCHVHGHTELGSENVYCGHVRFYTWLRQCCCNEHDKTKPIVTADFSEECIQTPQMNLVPNFCSPKNIEIFEYD